MRLLKRIFSRKRIYTELSESIQEHLEEKIDELIENGMSPEDASRAAKRSFGNATLFEQQSREVWQWARIETLWADVKITLRQMRKTPGSTTVALLIIALGIGASTAVFSIVNSVLLQPFAFRDSGQLVTWRETIQEAGSRYPSVPDNYRHFLYLKEHCNSLIDAALLQNASFAVAAGEGHPRIVKGLNVSPNFFSVLGVTPILGRAFLPNKTQPGDDGVLITWAAWNDFFHADPGTIGRSLTIKGHRQTVIGVLPKNFEFPLVSEMPGGETPGQTSAYQIFQPLIPSDEDRTSNDAAFAFLAVARLKPGITAKQASGELDGMLRAYGTSNHLAIHLGANVEPFTQEVTGDVSKALWLLFAAVLGLLLIACINLSSLQLVRAIARDRDNALRAALGAGKSRLFQATLMESLVLAAVGGAVGIGFAFAGIRLFRAIAPANLPRIHEIEISWPVLVFACGVSMLSAILAGTLPALRALHTDPQRALQSVSTRIGYGRGAGLARRWLVSCEIACTVVLLIVTGLAVRSFSRVINERHDFDANRVTVAEVDLLDSRYEQGQDGGASARSEFIDRALDSLRTDPGIEFAAVTSRMPLTGDASVFSIYRPDHFLPESEVPMANLRNISPGYFAAIQTPLVAGSGFTESERDHPDNAVISQKAAQAAWPEGQPLGRTLKMNGRVYTVIGVAADARIANLKENLPVVYLPFWHDPPSTVFFLLRSSQATSALASVFQRQIWQIDPGVAIPVVKSLDLQMTESVGPERLQAVVLSAFGAAALLLATLGVYGVLSYSVSLRVPEFGVRIALGSGKWALIRLVLLEASTPVITGIAVGLVASIGATHAIRSLLYETSAIDPATIEASVGLLLFTTYLAALLPAYRASRTDPMRVLRQE